MEKYELYNQIAREIVKNYNTYLHPEDVKTVTLAELEVAPHFTISHVLENDLASKIYEIALKLKAIDDSIILNKLENLHITLFWKGLESKLDEKSKEIAEIISSHNYEFDVEGLLFGPLGINIKFYPKNESLVDTRTKLCELTGTKFNMDERSVTTWAHFATFSKIPKPEVKQFVHNNADVNLGQYKPRDFTLYVSHNKGLDNPKVITTFNCK